MLTTEQFTNWLRIRRGSAGKSSLSAIGQELGVTRQAVHQWINGTATPSDTVLLLAERIMREPRDLSCGLPSDGRRPAS